MTVDFVNRIIRKTATQQWPLLSINKMRKTTKIFFHIKSKKNNFEDHVTRVTLDTLLL
jgi:hypothetical protein